MITNEVRILRAKHRMSQEVLAKKADTSRQTISAIENGRTPSLEIALNIAKVFNVPVNEIFFNVSVNQDLQNNSSA